MKNVLPFDGLDQVFGLQLWSWPFWAGELNEQKVLILEAVFLARVVDEIGAGALRMAQFGDLHPDSKLRLDDLQLGDRVFVDLLDGRRRNLLHLVAKLLVKFAPCYVVPRCLVLRVHASDVL